jgi:hypothetical protein
MSAQLTDRVVITCGEHATKIGHVLGIRDGIATVSVPSERPGWPFPSLIEVPVEDCQRAEASS